MVIVRDRDASSEHGERRRCAHAGSAFSAGATMSYVLPGEIVPAKHVNLKLGPGLLQVEHVGQEPMVIATKAGELTHSANNKSWAVISNSRRVRGFLFCCC